MNRVESNWEDSEQGLSVAKRQLMAGVLCSQWQPGGNAVQPLLLDPGLKHRAAPRNHAELAQLLSKRVTGSCRNFLCPHILRLHCTSKYLRPPAFSKPGTPALSNLLLAEKELPGLLWGLLSSVMILCTCPWQSYLSPPCNWPTPLTLSAPLRCAS